MASHNNHSNGFYKESLNKWRIKFDFEDEDSKINFQYYYYLLWDYKWTILAITVCCILLAGLVAFLKTPIYESKGSLMIKKSPNQYSSSSSDLSSLLTNSYGIGLGNSIADELQILRSRKLSNEVADTLLYKRLMANGRQYPILFESYPNDSALAGEETVAYRLRQHLTFQQVDQESNLIDITYKSPSPQEAADVVNLTVQLYSRISTQQNRKSANSAVEFLEQEKSRIQKKLYQAEQDLQQYMNQNELVQVDAQTQSLIERTSNLEQRRQEAHTKLVTTNSAIKQYQNQLNKIKPGLADQFADAVGPDMARLQYQLAEFKTERMKLLSRNPELKNSENRPEELQTLNRQIEEYQQKIRSLTQSVLKKGDQYLSFLSSEGGGDIAKNVAELEQKLIQLKVQQQQFQSQNSVLTKEIDKLNKVFDNLPENMIRLARLKRNVRINEELYLTVSKQHAEMSLWKQTQFGQGQLIDKGFVAKEPVEPNTPKYLLMGFFLGLLLGGGYVYARESFNTVIDGTQKLKQFELPVLSVIPDLGKYSDKEFRDEETVTVQGKEVSTQMVTLLDAISPVAESFRRLESNLLHSSPDNTLKSLVVTSTKKGEGKTTVVSNLGVIMAEADQDVIIVDTDLRRPNLQRMFGVERSPGLVDVIFEDILLEEAIKPTSIPNLNVLTAGSRPLNPSIITKSERFKQLIKKLEYQYDRVLLDTSPFGIITDSASIIDEADGVLVVCRFGETKTGKLEHTLLQLEQVEAHVLGLVLNGFNADHSSDYYYGGNYYEEFYKDYTDYNKA